MATSAILAAVIGFLGLFLTVVGSAVGLAAYITGHLSRIETELKHAFQRIEALEADKKNAPAPRARKRHR